MTIPRLNEMRAYWSIHPPVHVLVGSFFGEGKRQHKEVNEDLSGFAELQSALGASVSSEKPEWLKKMT